MELSKKLSAFEIEAANPAQLLEHLFEHHGLFLKDQRITNNLQIKTYVKGNSMIYYLLKFGKKFQISYSLDNHSSEEEFGCKVHTLSEIDLSKTPRCILPLEILVDVDAFLVNKLKTEPFLEDETPVKYLHCLRHGITYDIKSGHGIDAIDPYMMTKEIRENPNIKVGLCPSCHEELYYLQRACTEASELTNH
ncbi:MAG: hypothetical protein QT05_C0006G0021 [archaeon GW2011_AR13]|nr:MAG: hypothetical protein QT05_C0006G0021 [archaeon GW2011_AR13]HIG95224.1 hypothetical protein [Nanoarchaeota archaeon]HIH63105.1 hypothetical protein [Nanoarchaeota archaeon]HIJ09160.1 hypothetical protein [Nanoarchaeota archaeon]